MFSIRPVITLLFLLSMFPVCFGFENMDSLDLPAVTLDELNVTALKQSSLLKEEAVSSTLLTRAQIEESGVASVKGISELVPNFYIPDYGSRITSSIYVRGIGARMDQPAIGMIVDNIPILNKDAFDFDIFDIAFVEMLRGPQSTLYGRNTMTGLINVSTLNPMRYQGIRIMGEVSSAWSMRIGAGWYGKQKNNLANAVTGSFYFNGGHFRNEYNGKKVDKEYSGALRWRLHWNPNKSLSLMNVASATMLRQGGYPYQSLESGKIAYNDTCFYRRFTFMDGLTARLRGDKVNWVSITSVQVIDDNMTLDQDFLPESYFTLTQKKKEVAVTEDIVARNSVKGEHYNWTTGFFGFYKHLNMLAPVTFKDEGIRSLIENHRNDANPYYPIKWDSREFPLNSDFTIPTVGAALYHQSEFNVGNWKFTAGLRLDYEHTSLYYRSHCDTGYTVYAKQGDTLVENHHVDIDIDDNGHLKRHFFNWLPSLSVLYQFEEKDMNLFLNVAKGSKAGGFNTQMFSDVLQQRLMGIMGIGSNYRPDEIVGYKPEYSWNYEIGTHLGFPSCNLVLDATLFYIDCRNQQLTMFPDGTTTGRIMANAGQTRSFGGEVTANWSPFSWGELNVNYGYTNARFVKFNDGIHDYKGKRLPYAPSNTLFVQTLFHLSTKMKSVKQITFDLNLRGTGNIYWNESNTLSQPLYFLLGASATFEAEKWELQIWGKNLTSTDYSTFYFMSMGNEFLQKARPIECGVTFRLNI